jgi:hypothetical protein
LFEAHADPDPQEPPMPDETEPGQPEPTFDDALSRMTRPQLDPHAALARLRLHRKRREQARQETRAW